MSSSPLTVFIIIPKNGLREDDLSPLACPQGYTRSAPPHSRTAGPITRSPHQAGRKPRSLCTRNTLQASQGRHGRHTWCRQPQHADPDRSRAPSSQAASIQSISFSPQGTGPNDNPWKPHTENSCQTMLCVVTFASHCYYMATTEFFQQRRKKKVNSEPFGLQAAR